MNNLEINGYQAVISYDPEINMFRGEFVGINGGADFYATTVDELRKEGEVSLKAFLEMCAEEGVEPRKHYSGKFNLRVPPALHERRMAKASTPGSPNYCRSVPCTAISGSCRSRYGNFLQLPGGCGNLRDWFPKIEATCYRLLKLHCIAEIHYGHLRLLSR